MVRLLFWVAILFCLPALGWAKPRTIYLVAPVPQGKFPPAWTETIHLSLSDAPDPIQDHRVFKKGAADFRAALRGRILDQVYLVEVMCLSKGEKQIAVFRQSLKIKKGEKKFVLDKLKFVEWLKNP